jgi:hypothetical protein
MRTLGALGRLRFRQALRASLDSGRPTWMRCIRRPIILLATIVFFGAQLFFFAEGWVSDHSDIAHPIIVALLRPELTAFASATGIVIFFYAFTGLITSLTDSKALRLLLLAPVSPRLIVGERILTTSLGFSGLLAICIPALLAIGVIGLPPAYFMAVLVVIVVLPVAPTPAALLLLCRCCAGCRPRVPELSAPWLAH